MAAPTKPRRRPVLLVALSVVLTAGLALAPSTPVLAEKRSPGVENPVVGRLRADVAVGRLAPTLSVVNSMAPTAIVQFPFLTELAAVPFGNVEYVADLTTRGDGSGETVFNAIALDAFAMDARNPGTSTDDRAQTTSGVNLEHLGMWFSSLDDAKRILGNDTLKGTIFDGGSPPLHAGPQAMTDGQTTPVF